MSVNYKYKIFTTSQTFTIPDNVENIKIELYGAGGGGSCDVDPSHVDGHCGGGYAGKYAVYEMNVNSGDIHDIVIGVGGLGGSAHSGGRSGGTTYALKKSIAGGHGGTWQDVGSNVSYKGNGQGTCGYTDGKLAVWEHGYSWGGQASCVGNGGSGGNGDYGNGGNGGPGAGGGGMHSRSSASKGGNGGNGQVKLSWIVLPEKEDNNDDEIIEIGSTECCRYVPKDFIAWKDGYNVPVLIPPYRRKK